MANAVAEESDATAGNADTPYLDGDVLGAGWLNGNTDHDGRLEDSLNWQFSNGRTRGKPGERILQRSKLTLLPLKVFFWQELARLSRYCPRAYSRTSTMPIGVVRRLSDGRSCTAPCVQAISKFRSDS